MRDLNRAATIPLMTGWRWSIEAAPKYGLCTWQDVLDDEGTVSEDRSPEVGPRRRALVL
jgi:hypothetical protein